jgi:peptide/nickel transport system ATP-binding protein
MTLLEVKDLSIVYQTRRGPLRAVEEISFTLDAGKTLGFVGESGCGKSTIGMALMGLLPPNATVTSGTIHFAGHNLLTLSEDALREVRWQKIAMIFQAAMNALNPVHRVADQVAEAILTHTPGISKASAMDQVKKLFELVEIPAKRMTDYPHQYSGGMKQRAVIAMALACRPDLIIADEPTTALDVIVQAQILEEIKTIQKELNLGILFISHDISVVADVCDHIGVMYAGQLIEYGHRQAVFDSPGHPYTRKLVGAHQALMGAQRRPQTAPDATLDLVNPPPGCRFCIRCPVADDTCRKERPRWQALSADHKIFCCHSDPNG